MELDSYLTPHLFLYELLRLFVIVSVVAIVFIYLNVFKVIWYCWLSDWNGIWAIEILLQQFTKVCFLRTRPGMEELHKIDHVNWNLKSESDIFYLDLISICSTGWGLLQKFFLWKSFGIGLLSCYYYALLYGVADGLFRRLQSVQNAAARLVSGVRRSDHITPTLRRLHWLPVRQRVLFTRKPCYRKDDRAMHPIYGYMPWNFSTVPE